MWFLGSYFILTNLGVPVQQAWPDALAFTGVFLVILFILELVFGFYIPQGKNTWLLVVIPVLLSFIAVFAHKLIMKWVFGDQLDYLNVLDTGFYLRWAILAVPAVLIAIIALVVSKLEQQGESQKREAAISELAREAELMQIRQQLQPHFLFNSLNSISALVVAKPQKAREMVLQLSDFLRGTIRKDHQEWVVLEEELNYLRMYLDIERVRFGHRLQVKINVTEEVKSVRLPQLLIQPLLENAIKHGLYGLTGEVEIKLEAFTETNYVYIKVQNPFDPESAVSSGAGFGLNSVKRRLELLFGRTDLLSSVAKEGEFLVTLKIPQIK
ncbi:sensor histidine kinase [Algoriphagus machipongonensis]|uniref:Sensor histidine kinase n=2 Tax=Algoriphagus machipongonensis TaxID=388413 RepID=A3HWW7_9BACT|nr:sensor histidine kinase [Algoriphagus machipongonensis]